MFLKMMKYLVLILPFSLCVTLQAEVLVYKWKQMGSEVYSEDEGNTYERRIKDATGYMVVDLNATTLAYTNAQIVEAWKDNDGKWVTATDFGSGEAVFEKLDMSKGNRRRTTPTVLISIFNDDDQGEFYSGKARNMSAARLGGNNNLEIAKSLTGHSAWSYSIQNRLEYTGQAKVSLRLDTKRTKNANISGQTVDQVINDIKTEYTTRNYVNPAPTAVDDTATCEMDDFVDLTVLSNDYDPQNSVLTVDSITVDPTHGAAVINTDKTITYTPNAGWFGVDQFSYQVSNGFGSTDTATVTVTVTYNKTTEIVSVDSGNVQGDSASGPSCINRDGRYVVFKSYATNIATGGSADPANIYIYDRGKKGIDGCTLLINEGSNGEKANYGAQNIAPNGKVIDDTATYVAFSSEANNLLLSSDESLSINDTNGVSDVFIRYREDVEKNPNIELYPRVLVGEDATNDNSFTITNNTNGTINYDIEVRDWIPAASTNWCLITSTGLTTATVSVPRDSTLDVGLTYETSTLGIGTYYCTIYVDNGDIHRVQLTVYDTQIRRVSVDSNDNESNGASYGGVISSGAGHITFYSEANNLVANDTNAKKDVFVYSTANAGTTVRVSVTTGGVESNGDSIYPCISSDGKYVVFVSDATNLDAAATNGKWQIYLHDRDVTNSGTFDTAGNISTTLISRVTGGGVQGDGDSSYPYISGPDAANNYFVVYQSSSSNLDPTITDTNGVLDIFMYNLNQNTTARVSIANDGSTQGNADSSLGCITTDGNYVYFQSDASNLITGDTNGKKDIFVRSLLAGTTSLISRNDSGEQGNGDSTYPSVATDGNNLLTSYMSTATNLVSDDTNNAADVFVDIRDDENN